VGIGLGVNARPDALEIWEIASPTDLSVETMG
jgi:hypothetical protein